MTDRNQARKVTVRIRDCQEARSRRALAAAIAAALIPIPALTHAQAGATAPGTAATGAAPALGTPPAATTTPATGPTTTPGATTGTGIVAPAAGTVTAPAATATPDVAGQTAPATAGTAAPPATGVNTTAASPATVTATPGPPPAAAKTPEILTTITLGQVLDRVIGNNSAIQLAQERLRKAGYLVDQSYAEARPQIHVSVTDTQTSYKTFSAGGGGGSSSVSLPGGGQIPTITDTGGGTNGTVIAGGGGGTSPVSTYSGGNTNTAPQGGATGADAGQAATTNGGAASAHASAFRAGASASHARTAGAIATPQGVTTVPHALVANATGGSGTFGNSGGGYYNNAGASLTVSQPIDILGYVRTGIDVEKRTRTFYQIDLDRTANEIALTTKSSFFNLLKAIGTAGVYQDLVTADQENVRIATAKFTAGTAARYDVLTAQTTLANDQQSLISAQDQVNLATANLNSALGQPLDTALTPVPPPLPPLDQPIDLTGAVNRAYTNRPELREAENNIEIAKGLIKIAGATLSPSLNLNGSANYSQHISSGSHDTYALSATLDFPLYDGGATKARVRSAQSDLTTQLLTRSQLRQSAELEVRQAYLNANDARARAAAASASVESAQEAYRLSQLRYQNGLSTFVEVTTSQAQLATARTNLNNAQYDYQTSLAQLLRAEGGR